MQLFTLLPTIYPFLVTLILLFKRIIDLSSHQSLINLLTSVCLYSLLCKENENNIVSLISQLFPPALEKSNKLYLSRLSPWQLNMNWKLAPQIPKTLETEKKVFL